MMRSDIVIVGGGMVGAAAACALGRQGLKVTLLEKRPPAPLEGQPCCQTRASALTLASRRLLEALGAWEALTPWAQPFDAMHVWSDDVSGEVVFRAAEVGAEALGWVVPNAVVQSALWQALPETVTVRESGLAALDAEAGTVTLENGESLEARLIVGADGAHSLTRRLAGIPLDSHEYGQAAIVGCVRTEKPHENACWQRYTADGPVAFLAMGEGWSSLAWYVPLNRLEETLALPDEVFRARLEAASGARLGRIVEVGERAGFPLVRRHARRYVQGRVALVGDAAHTVHPQAGQGVNLGLLDVAVLAEEIGTDTEADWAHTGALQRYQRRRYGDNLLVQRAMDGFDGLFDHSLPWKRPLRQAVLTAGRTLSPARALLTDLALRGRWA
ncbi:FAD-dependent oxidoreductase [Sulfurivirga sp.]|uniref:FAD-dependent oxidoreductase n=1 Tax=Sulfurivirga sp. TaxID=2614236 RepID=UPI0025F01D62|nr:FAD-dependent oxidoreductase [Sulfurivirga sp.]